MAWGVNATTNGSAPTAPTGGLASIMSEQLAEKLDDSFSATLEQAAKEEVEPVEPAPRESEAHDEAADLALAMQLQEEEEASLDAYRQSRHRHQLTGNVTMRARFRPLEEHERERSAREATEQRRLYTADDAEELTAELESLREALAAAALDQQAQLQSGVPGRRDKSLKGQGGDGEIVTKHDADDSGARNWRKLEEDMGAAGRVSSGAGGRQEHRISNRVYNSLRHSLRKQQHAPKGLSSTVERETQQTYAKGLDHKTRLVLHKLINLGLLREVNGIVRTGKEAVVYQAFGDFDSAAAADGETAMERLPERVQLTSFAVKVFKTTLNEFKNRMDYVRGDYRFATVQELSHQNPRKVVRVWAEKEMRNLSRVRRAGIPCPYPVRLVNNVLVMEFIGADGWAAPQLREAVLSARRTVSCYAQVTALMHGLVTMCGLVHADLSEYNVLYDHGTCVLIDLGQAVLMDHPRARAFLLKDCENVTRFFAARGVPHLLEPRALCDLLVAAADEHASARPAGFAEACERWAARVTEFVSSHGSGSSAHEGPDVVDEHEPANRAEQREDMIVNDI